MLVQWTDSYEMHVTYRIFVLFDSFATEVIEQDVKRFSVLNIRSLWEYLIYIDFLLVYVQGMKEGDSPCGFTCYMNFHVYIYMYICRKAGRQEIIPVDYLSLLLSCP